MEKNRNLAIQLAIKGMTWMSWVPKVTGALAGLPGIIGAEASYPEQEARVVYDPESIDVAGIVRGLSQAGYSAALKEDPTLVFPSLDSSGPVPFEPEDLVCYCFGYTRAAIEQDYIQNGRSLILEKIAAARKVGSCDCANKNPKGR